MKLQFATIILVILFLLSCAKQETQNRPNILWINIDDLGVELGCYGNPDVQTPNMDKLASEGIRFTKAYSAAPACSPSRSAVITGIYPTSVNCIEHRSVEKTQLPEGIVPVTEYFREAGYFCTNGSGTNMSKGGKTDFNFKYKAKYSTVLAGVNANPDSHFLHKYKFLNRIELLSTIMKIL